MKVMSSMNTSVVTQLPVEPRYSEIAVIQFGDDQVEQLVDGGGQVRGELGAEGFVIEPGIELGFLSRTVRRNGPGPWVHSN
jgi:hypothetical protein